MNLRHSRLLLFVVILFALLTCGGAQAQDRFSTDLLKHFTYRNLGPFRAGSWVTSFAVPAAPARDHLYTLYVGTRNGGVWKTTNGGTTFESVFDDQPKLSIGDVAVALTDANIVYVGTGEAYCARSSHAGDGMYKSTDAGRTWTHIGLRDTQHIARIIIHPQNPDIVYVAAMGHLFSDNAERGVFRTMDGGRSWEKVLFVSDKIGAIDLVMVLSNPDVVYAAVYDKVRLPWHYEAGGPESAIYKTANGGKTWLRLSGGLPAGRIGRIGLDVFQKDPNILSPHNPAIVYVGAQILFRSYDRGDHWDEISPDLTTNDKSKQGGAGNITFCTIFSVSESPVKAGVIWVGTDDGRVQVTRDGGATWLDRTANVAAAGGPAHFWVSRVFASPHDAGTAFVSKSGMRFDDFRACLYKTADYGATWASVAGNLPNDRSVNVLVQDRKNPNLLFVGTEQGIFVTIDGGVRWLPLRNNMPWVKVTDLLIHPRENDLVAATYGRGVWVVDITPLQEMKAGVPAEDIYLFDIEPRTQRMYGGIGNYQLLGDSHLFTPNEPNAVIINYYLKNRASEPVKITVADPYGQILAELRGQGEAGMNSAQWNMRARTAGPAGTRGGGMGGALVDPGEYVVTLEAAGRKLTKKAIIRYRQGWTVGAIPYVIQRYQ